MSISAEHVSLIYQAGTPQETAALRDVSVTIKQGEFVGIMGHTGCGKSTLLQLLAGLIVPTEGRIRMDGADIHDRKFHKCTLRQTIGVLFQSPECQLFETTVEKDVAFGLRHTGASKKETAARVRWALEAVGFSFDAVRSLSPLGLSGGEKRRVALAGVLALKPEYLLLDEPVAGLDPQGRADFLALLRRLNREGMTVVMISHNADALAECAQRILVLEQGRLVEDGTTASVFRDPETLRRRKLDVGHCRNISALLAQGGMVLPSEPVRYDALLQAILQALKGGDTA